MKYVMLQVETDNCIQKIPVIFPKQLNHIDVAEAIAPLLQHERSEVKPVSAGDVNVSGVQCHGNSPTLRLQAEADDAMIINTNDYMHGLVG